LLPQEGSFKVRPWEEEKWALPGETEPRRVKRRGEWEGKDCGVESRKGRGRREVIQGEEEGRKERGREGKRDEADVESPGR
jgi:hypothetical protein